MIRRTAIRSAFAIATTLLLSLTAHAQLFRAYVSSTGSDTNPCTLPAPCRLLPAALAAVANGGEIWMLDSGNYNTATVTIGKSVSILAVPGAVGSVLAIGGPAISITAASLAVALRNLVIVPLPNGGGTVGISMTGASTLTIEDSLIANLTADGVKVVGIGAVRIANTTFRNNAGGYAVFAQNGARVMISGTRMLGNFGGVTARSDTATTTTAAISDSIVSGSADAAAYALAQAAGASARIVVTRCTMEGNAYGVDSEVGVGGSTLVSVGGSTITHNVYGWYRAGTGSVIETYGNNEFRNNADSFGTLTNVVLQ